MLHNETVNVWSHMVGSLGFVGLIIYVSLLFTPEKSWLPMWPLFTQMFATMTMLGCSAYFHLFCCQNCSAYTSLQKLDYAGIAVMIAGSATCPIYYGFPCPEVAAWRWLWLGLVWFFCLTALFLVYFPVKKKVWLNALAWNVAGYSTMPFVI